MKTTLTILGILGVWTAMYFAGRLLAILYTKAYSTKKAKS